MLRMDTAQQRIGSNRIPYFEDIDNVAMVAMKVPRNWCSNAAECRTRDWVWKVEAEFRDFSIIYEDMNQSSQPYKASDFCCT